MLAGQWLSQTADERDGQSLNVILSSLSHADKTESVHFARVLRRLGHKVFECGLPSALEHPVHGFSAGPGLDPRTSINSLARIAGFAPDLFLYIEPNGLIPPGMEQANCAAACILSDTHRDLAARIRLARFFDYVFLYHRNYTKAFTEHDQQNVRWLPYACDHEFFRPLGTVRDLDVVFIGHWAHGRAGVLDKLAARHTMNERRYYLQHEIPQVYSRAKIVLNLPAADDLNFRTFEAMACGALLLTRRIANGQEALFEEDRHFVAYEDDAEMTEKIRYYLQRSEEREAIAHAGLAEVQRVHGLENRIADMIAAVAQGPQGAPIRRMSSAQVDREYAWLYEQERQLQPGIDLMRDARRRGAPWVALVPPVVRSCLRAVLR